MFRIGRLNSSIRISDWIRQYLGYLMNTSIRITSIIIILRNIFFNPDCRFIKRANSALVWGKKKVYILHL